MEAPITLIIEPKDLVVLERLLLKAKAGELSDLLAPRPSFPSTGSVGPVWKESPQRSRHASNS
jgi:hypothetical protein